MHPWVDLLISIGGPILSAILIWVGKKLARVVTSLDKLTDEMKLMHDDYQNLHRRVDITDRIISDIIGVEYDSDSVRLDSKKYPRIPRKKTHEH